jgi:hypothetical protein
MVGHGNSVQSEVARRYIIKAAPEGSLGSDLRSWPADVAGLHALRRLRLRPGLIRDQRP